MFHKSISNTSVILATTRHGVFNCLRLKRHPADSGNSNVTTKVDVVVVGGGFSGLAAAFRCHEAGLKTIVLEAKHRIGGRSRTYERLSGPGVIELGATWINETSQPEVFALKKRLGLETTEQYTVGDSVYQRLDGSVIRGSDDGTNVRLHFYSMHCPHGIPS